MIFTSAEGGHICTRTHTHTHNTQQHIDFTRTHTIWHEYRLPSLSVSMCRTYRPLTHFFCFFDSFPRSELSFRSLLLCLLFDSTFLPTYIALSVSVCLSQSVYLSLCLYFSLWLCLSLSVSLSFSLCLKRQFYYKKKFCEVLRSVTFRSDLTAIREKGARSLCSVQQGTKTKIITFVHSVRSEGEKKKKKREIGTGASYKQTLENNENAL